MNVLVGHDAARVDRGEAVTVPARPSLAWRVETHTGDDRRTLHGVPASPDRPRLGTHEEQP